MAKPNRPPALLAYLLPLIGPLLVIALQRRSTFALYHACQALALLLGALVIPLGWGVLGWAVAWVPLIGPVLTAFGFSLVIAGYIMLAVAWLLGLVNVARGRMNPLPIFGGWGERLFTRLTPAASTPALVETVQPASRP